MPRGIPVSRRLALGDVLVTFLGSWVLFGAFALVAVLISAGSSLRGRAIGATVGIVVASFFANFIALLLDEVSDLRYASPFHYFRPADILEGEAVAELGVLVALGIAAGLLALWRFGRPDLTR